MAYPYPGTPTWAPPQQQSYYPPYPLNGPQQSTGTPTGVPPQHAPAHPHMPFPAQPSPSTNGPRFDNNAHVPPPAPFPPFPPPNFNSDFFKQFANSGFPPPPPPPLPNFPPLPISNAGYPQLPSPANASVSSPYPQYHADGVPGQTGGYTQSPHDQSRLFGTDQFVPSPREAPGNSHLPQAGHTYGAPKSATKMGGHGHGHGHASRPATKNVESEKDQSLPSFGSRQDLNMLFATMQNQMPVMAPEPREESPALPIAQEPMDETPPEDGSASPYDPTRPATLPDRASAGSFTSHSGPRNGTKLPSERTYDNKSIVEMRQLAKGAVLSLVPHKILFSDLVKEGIDPAVLRALYQELGVKVTREDAQKDEKVSALPVLPIDDVGSQPPQTMTDEYSPTMSLPIATAAMSKIPPPPIPAVEATKEQPLPNSNSTLERKDRIALLLAAKTGRPTPPPSSALPTVSNVAPTSLPSSIPASVTASASQTPPAISAGPLAQPSSIAAKSKAQTELVRQKMEQLKREAQAKVQSASSQATSLPIAQLGPVMPSIGGAVAALAKQSTMTSLIPGLFMSPAEASEVDQAVQVAFQDTLTDNAMSIQASAAADQGTSSVPANLKTKRPSDFDSLAEEPVTKKANLSHPGQISPAQVVDDQSEGEVMEDDEDDAMVIDARVGQHGTGQQLQEVTSALADIPRLPVGGDQSGDHLYRAKQSEIETMRRRIAEMEQRNKLKRTRSQQDSPMSSKGDQQFGSSPVAQVAELSSPIAPRQASGTRTRLTPAQLKERTAALRAEVLKQRTQRQDVLQQGLPDLNAEVQKTETRLESSRNELASLRAQIQSLRTQLDRLVVQEAELNDEVVRYEQQLEEGQAGQKQYSDELQQIKIDKLADEEVTPVQNAVGDVPAHETVHSTDTQGALLSNGDVAYSASANPTQIGAPVATESELPATTEHDVDLAGQSAEEPPTSYQIQPPSQEAEVQASLQKSPDTDQPEADDMEISPEPEAYEETHETLPSTFDTDQDTPMSVEVDDDNEGSVSMSGSDDEEGDYEPADADDDDQPMQQSDDEGEYDPEAVPVERALSPPGPEDGNEDFYEPSEHHPVTDEMPSPPEVLIDGSENAYTDMDGQPSSAEEGELPDEGLVSEVPAHSKDDLDTNVLRTETDALSKIQLAPNQSRRPDSAPLLTGTSSSSIHFEPYKTPLSAFKSYRFHPTYNDTVKTGYRSLTYSNSIDPARPLCPTELSGQVCSDTSCEEQHFSQLGLPDDKILVQMSSAADIKDKATKEQFHAGLKKVIADLRTNDVKDFEKVADALSKYRREFFAERDDQEVQEQES